MGLIACFTSRCKVHFADEIRGTRWDGQKNEVITFSREAKINTAGSTFSGELQTALLSSWLCKTKNEVVVSLDNFLCILIWRSLSNLKEKFTTAFSHKRIHTALHSPKQVEVEWPQARKCRQCSTTPGDYYITHSMHVQDDVLYTARRCNNFEFMIHLMIVGLLKSALFQCLKCQDKRISKNCRSTFILSSSWNVWGGPFFTFSVPWGGQRAPLLPVSYVTGCSYSRFSAAPNAKVFKRTNE